MIRPPEDANANVVDDGGASLGLEGESAVGGNSATPVDPQTEPAPAAEPAPAEVPNDAAEPIAVTPTSAVTAPDVLVVPDDAVAPGAAVPVIDPDPLVDESALSEPAAVEPDAATTDVASPPQQLFASAHPLASAPIVGDPGRQREIVSSLGPLTIGVADTALDFARVEPFEIRACSTRGLSHRYAGTPRQDSFAIAADDNWLVLAVTDGVSQGHFSHIAAELVARGACKLAIDAEPGADIDWQQVSIRLSTRIVEEARIRGLVRPKAESEGVDQVSEVKQLMSTTAVVARIARTSTASGNLAGQLAVLAGDSGAYRIAQGSVSVLLGGKDVDSMISSTQVRPLPGAVEPDVVDFELAPGEAVMLTTDGVGDSVEDGDSEMGRELGRLWTEPPGIDEFLLHTNFFRKTFDDDRTAVVAWNRPTRSAT